MTHQPPLKGWPRFKAKLWKTLNDGFDYVTTALSYYWPVITRTVCVTISLWATSSNFDMTEVKAIVAYFLSDNAIESRKLFQQEEDQT